MAIEKGDVAPESAGSSKGVNERMLKLISELRGEVEELKSSGKPQQAIAVTGEQNEVLKELVAQLSKKTDKEKFETDNGYVDMADIDPEDYDPIGTPFFAYFVGYLILDDTRKGHRVKTPYGDKILFDYQATIKTGPEKNPTLSNYCQFISYSEKTTKWLQEHTLFNVVFFKKLSDALNVDAFQANKQAQYMSSMSSMSLDQIVKMCVSEGVAVSDNPDDMKAKLAVKKAHKDLGIEQKAHIAMLQGNKDEELFRSKVS